MCLLAFPRNEVIEDTRLSTLIKKSKNQALLVLVQDELVEDLVIPNNVSYIIDLELV